MEYLVSKGVEPAVADEIVKITMFGTAKTKLLPEHVKTMSEHGVPWWYINSLKKFKFLFPRSVIAEYAKYMVQLVWYDLCYPDEYFVVYFESKRNLFDRKALEIICGGAEEKYKRICDIRLRMSSEESSELVKLLKTAYEAIGKGR